jgi:hypothetical protein
MYPLPVAYKVYIFTRKLGQSLVQKGGLGYKLALSLRGLKLLRFTSKGILSIRNLERSI